MAIHDDAHLGRVSSGNMDARGEYFAYCLHPRLYSKFYYSSYLASARYENTIRFKRWDLSGEIQRGNASTRMAEGMDADVARYQGTTIHGTISGGSSLEISNRQKGPRGAIGRVLTLPTAFTQLSPI